MSKLTRRRTILGAMSAGAAALAGCVVDDNSESNDPGDDNSDNGDNSENDGETEIVETSLFHKRSDCADGDGDAAVVHDGTTYLVDGIALAGNPCHEPVLADATIEDGELSVSVDVAHSELGENEGCIDCHGEVAYEAALTVDEADAVDTVVVNHGETEYTIDREEFSTAPHVYTSEIETLDADCGTPETDAASVTFDNGNLTVEGRLSAGDPCHDAALEGVSVMGDQLHIDVKLLPYEEEGGACDTCIGEIRYEATAAILNSDGLTEVVVSHAGGDDHEFNIE